MALIKAAEHYAQRPNLMMPQKGIVVDNRDPRGIGRVKACVGGILEGDDAFREKLPWIMPWAAIGQGGSAGKASVPVPDIGDVIAVEFKFNDIYSGFYTGHWNSKVTAPGAFNADYPKSIGTSDQVGNQTLVNKEKKTTEWNFASGAKVKFGANGDITFVTKGKVRFESEDGESFSEHAMQDGVICNKGGESTRLEGREVRIQGQEYNTDVENMTEQIKGARVTAVDGSLINTVGGSYQNVVAGNSSIAVTGTSEDLYTLLAKRTYGTGYQEDVVLGNILQNLIAGNISVNITIGNEVHSIAAGNYSVNVAAGNIVLQTLAGSVTIGAGAGSILIDPAGGVTITSAAAYTITSAAAVSLTAGASMSLTAPTIVLNGGVGQVLTNLTAPIVDTITGAPHIGNPTVLA